MAGKEPEVGPTMRTVAANITRLRTAQNLSYTDVSTRLEKLAGWALTPVAVRRIEDAQRRVTADDLMALAVALRVSPITLLMENTGSPDDSVEVTGLSYLARRVQLNELPASFCWAWLRADDPPPAFGLNDEPRDISLEFYGRALPNWRVTEMADGFRQIASLRAGETAEAESEDNRGND